MIPTTLLTLSSVLLYSSVVNSQCLSDFDNILPSKASKLNLYKNEMDFTLSTLLSINKATPNENVFFSPYSIFHAVLLAYFGSKGQTENSVRNALKLNWAESKAHVMQAYRSEKSNRMSRSAANNSIEFVSADRIYLDKEVKVRDCIDDLLHEEIKTLDFKKKPEESRLEINNWISNFTKGNIKDILPSGSVTQMTRLVLANAAYFKGTWVSKFDPADTKSEIFYISQQEYTFVDMMHLNGSFYHATNDFLACHVLEMPYNGHEMSLYILLPSPLENGLEKVLSRLTVDRLQELLESGSAREVIITLPKFKFEKEVELVPILNDLGVGDLFEPSANLTGFADENLSLDDALHKSIIEVDENGATAASATVLFSFRSSRVLEPVEFKCDHPFIFFIYDNKSRAVLFSGIYRNPDKK